ncbi:MAG: hypothetical protein CVV64_17640, partial [Candidatus Wallbacteria bacterium HGW-Wallbacteria-1]
LKYYRDVKNSIDTAWDEGKAIGIQEGEAIGIQKTAVKLFSMGIAIADISLATGLTREEIEVLTKDMMQSARE